ncbi:hydrolase [Neobacillus sp. CF12]|uniref:hydrolase n=1 Tax=Neobacillus sp. CF12 TaxID=3055864 RepID=UPI0025A1148B|nr:hydrolase [Neobacillus sp. CF12]MDM5328307.1 hydrolase [Neobacillus sp. CF12]
MENRNFQMDTQWNIIHYPEKPTGFGILIIGDERHFVDESKCFWTQNEGKLAIINQLRESGYTIFSSNLYGRNWGSDQAVDLAQRLYQQVIRSEILNNKVHLVAEGMGALVAVKLMEKMKGQLRSIVLLNPILSLKKHIELEKEHKFFYKKLMRELTAAHKMDQITLEQELGNMDDEVKVDMGVPIKIIHVMSSGKSYNQSNQLQKLLANTDISPTYIVPEKKQQLGNMMKKFFNSYEKVL